MTNYTEGKDHTLIGRDVGWYFCKKKVSERSEFFF